MAEMVVPGLFYEVDVVSRRTAMTGQCPQEGPQLVAAQLPQPLPPAEVLPIFPPKADISRFTLTDPHFGQATDTFSSRLRKRISKLSLHFRHLNSKIGIGSFPPAECNIPRSFAADGNPLSFSMFGEDRRNLRKCQGRSDLIMDRKLSRKKTGRNTG
jgi:hypothetical protein